MISRYKKDEESGFELPEQHALTDKPPSLPQRPDQEVIARALDGQSRSAEILMALWLGISRKG